jgi:putative transposon-encoded protein
MSAQTITQQVRWQDFIVRNEVDTVLEIARRQGWQDCKVFGSGAMITHPREAQGWKLIPADMYEYSIPSEAASRVVQVINAGVRVQGVIIADDQRREKATPPAAPESPSVPLEWVKPLAARAAKALLRLAAAAGMLILAAGLAYILLTAAPLLIGVLVLVAFTGMGTEYDPKLVILVDDGSGGSTWIDLFTWYD